MFGVVSLTMGNSPLPVGDRLIADAQSVGQFKLGHIPFLAQLRYSFSDFYGIKHIVPLLPAGRFRHHQYSKSHTNKPATGA